MRDIKKINSSIYNNKWQKLIDSLLQTNYKNRFDINQVNKFLIKELKIKEKNSIGKIQNKINNMNINNILINNNNYIIAETEIKDNDINKDIRIINSYEEYMRKVWPSYEIKKEYMNEEKIKQCEIRINNKIIPFNYYYKFTQKGKYIIKYSYNNYLTNTRSMFYVLWMFFFNKYKFI